MFQPVEDAILRRRPRINNKSDRMMFQPVEGAIRQRRPRINNKSAWLQTTRACTKRSRSGTSSLHWGELGKETCARGSIARDASGERTMQWNKPPAAACVRSKQMSE